jgi:hypothetical protein
MIGGLMKSRKIMITVASIVALLSIGGCTVEHKEDAKQEKNPVSSSTKEAKKQKQVDFLKKHESEITNYIKENDPEVVWVKYDWDSVKVGDSGAFTESGFDIRLKVYGADDAEINGYSFFIVPKPNIENPISIDSISGSNFP